MRVEVRYNHLLRAPEKLQAEVRGIVEEAAAGIENEIRSTIPARHLPIRRDVSRRGFLQQIRIGSARRIYPGWLEFGTRFRPATPFATPAAEQARPVFMARMRRILRRL